MARRVVEDGADVAARRQAVVLAQARVQVVAEGVVDRDDDHNLIVGNGLKVSGGVRRTGAQAPLRQRSREHASHAVRGRMQSRVRAPGPVIHRELRAHLVRGARWARLRQPLQIEARVTGVDRRGRGLHARASRGRTMTERTSRFGLVCTGVARQKILDSFCDPMNPGSEAGAERATMRMVAAQQVLAARLRGCRDWPWHLWHHLPMCSLYGFYNCLPRACSLPPGGFAWRDSLCRHVVQNLDAASPDSRVRTWVRTSASCKQFAHEPWMPFSWQ